MYAGFLAVNQAWLIVVLFVFNAVASRSLFQLGTEWRSDLSAVAWWVWPAMIVADDFVFYWYHRAQHRVRLFWGTHEGHHDSEEFNYSVGLRQPWFQPFALLFWIPLVYVGFDPVLLLLVNGANFAFQELLHTKFIGRLGPFEWLFNTPSHHRVHHGSNPEYIDKNFGGIFIIWDRLFGTFRAESEPVRYGLPLARQNRKHSAASSSLSSLSRTLRDFARSTSADDAWEALFGPPAPPVEVSGSLERSG